jgi:SAM-dependent methyltransferase
VNDRPSTLGARVSGRRAGQRFDAENGVVTEALVFLGDLDPEAIGPNIAHATHYEPTPVADFDALLAHVPFAPAGATFVDVGSGMGRVVLLAARLPFRQVIGLEISRALHEIASDNLASAGRAAFRCRDVRLRCGDAATYRFPRGPLVAYLYNPFDASVLAGVLHRLATRGPEPLAIVYHTPVERGLLDAHPAFRVAGEERCGVVYCATG